MCLYVSSKYSRKRIAGYDILVYKWFRTGLYSPYWGKRYTTNKLYSIESIQKNRFYNDVHEGFHAYRSLPPRSDRIYRPCIIPKGSQFYIGDGNEIVSSAIIVKPKGWDKIQGNVKAKGDFSKHKKA